MKDLKLNQLNALHLDKDMIVEMADTQKKWLKRLVVTEISLALLNSVLLLTGTLMYGKETAAILKKRMENQT